MGTMETAVASHTPYTSSLSGASVARCFHGLLCRNLRGPLAVNSWFTQCMLPHLDFT